MKVIEFSYEERTGAQHFYSHHEVAIFQNDSHAAQDDAVEARATEALDMEHVHDCRDTFEACRAAVRCTCPPHREYSIFLGSIEKRHLINGFFFSSITLLPTLSKC